MRIMITHIVFKFYFCNLFCGVFFKTFTYLWWTWDDCGWGNFTYLWWTWDGCGIVLNFGGSFLDLTVFFIYLGGCWLCLVI